MASFEPQERRVIESYLEMGSGYVLDFNNRTFANFVADSTGKNIDDYGKYGEGSKANRLRAFFRVEQGDVVSKLLRDFVAYRRDNYLDQTVNDEVVENKVIVIAERINPPVLGGQEKVEALRPDTEDAEGTILFEQIRIAIGRNEHQAALDRLHTWMFRFIRNLCTKHTVTWNEGEALDAIYNKLSRFYRDKNHCESIMSATILKGVGKNLTEFNQVRNNQSFAHANPVLSQAEARFICNTTFDAVRFINGIEEKIDADKRRSEIDEKRIKDFPFLK